MSAERGGNGAERAENWVGGSGAVSGHSRKRVSGKWSVEREAAERRAGVTKIGLNGRSRSAHMLWLR